MEPIVVSPRHKIRLKYFDLMHSEEIVEGLGILSSDKSTFRPYFEDKKIREIIDAPTSPDDEYSIRGWEYIAKSITYYDLLATRQYFEFRSLYRRHSHTIQKEANTCLLLYLYYTFEVVKHMILLGLPMEPEHIPQQIESIRLLTNIKTNSHFKMPSGVLATLQYMSSDSVKQIDIQNTELYLHLSTHEVKAVQSITWEWYKNLHLTLKTYSVP